MLAITETKEGNEMKRQSDFLEIDLVTLNFGTYLATTKNVAITVTLVAVLAVE